MGIFQQKKADTKPDEFINIERLETDLAEFYNVTDQMRENTLDIFEVFNKLEPSIKSSKENRENKEIIKKFLEKNSKDAFMLRIFLKYMGDTIRKLSTDEVSNLQTKKLCYNYLTKLLTTDHKFAKLNNSNINNIKVYRYGGDEFVILVERNIGVEVVFIDLMYLNYFNDLLGHKGGDQAIFSASRIMENTVKNFVGKQIKTKDIIDKLSTNFDNFRFTDEFEPLNKIIFHLDTGYSNDGELKEIEAKYKREIDAKKIKVEYRGLSTKEKREALIELADIRSDFQKNISRMVLLTSLYKESLKNDKIKEILDGYFAFTKKAKYVRAEVESIVDSSKTEDEEFEKIWKDTEARIYKNSFSKFSDERSEQKQILNSIVFAQAFKNLCKKKPFFDVNNIVKRWGLD